MGELYSAWPRSHIIALTSDSVGDCLNKKKPRLVNLASWKMPFDWTAADPFEQRPFVRHALNLDPWLL